MPTISLHMIVRDVAPYIHHCLESIVPFVDEVVIVDTGSKDDTKDTIRSLVPAPRLQLLSFNETTHPKAFLRDAAKSWKMKMPPPFTSKKFLADFAAARNFGWRKSSSDFSLWLDSDDVFEHGERIPQVLEDMEREKVDFAMVNYDYTTDERGRVTNAMRRERIVRTKVGATFIGCIHESMPMPGKVKFYSQVNVAHQKSQLKISTPVANRNLKVLAKWFEEQESLEKCDPRMLFYLAMEERFLRPEAAIEHFNLYVKKSGWDEERAVAHCYVGVLHEKAERFDEAFKSFAAAQFEFDNRPEGHFGAARVAYWKQDWRKCIEWTEKGLAIAKDTSRSSMMFYDPLDRSYRPYVFYSRALAEVGEWEKVVRACEAGLAIEPEDPHLKGNLKLALRSLPKTEQRRAIDKCTCGDTASEHGDDGRGSCKKCDCKTFTPHPQPSTIEGDTIAFRVRGKIETASPTRSLDVTIWAGQAWEKWDGRSLSTTGIGGSETATVHMARELHKLGHRVTVVGDNFVEETIDDIVYTPFHPVQNGERQISGDVCIVSRQPWAVNYAKNFHRRYLWVHDVHVGQPSAALDLLLAKYDRIFVLSPWHEQFLRQTYPFVESKIWRTRNGIDTSRFAAEPRKDGNRLVYSSSWDRGLELLLKLLPMVAAKVPDVKLDVFYGSKLWRDLRPDQNDRIKQVEAALSAAEAQGLAVNHGRQPQDVVAKAFLAAKVWLYPTWFTETFCITALEAMAGGCVPVTVNLAALDTTISHGFRIPGLCSDPKVQENLVDITVRLLQDEDARARVATAGRAHTLQNCDWSQVAKEWEALFRKDDAESVFTLSPVSDPKKIESPAAPETSESQVEAHLRWAKEMGLEKPRPNPEPSPPQTQDLHSLGRIQTLSRKHRVAVMMGRLGAATHGVYNVDTLFDEGFMTGTGSNFFNIAWGLAERGHIVDAFCQATQRFIGHPKLAGVNVYNIDEPGMAPDDTYDAYVAINEPDLLRQAPSKALRLCATWLNDWSFTTAGFDEHVDLYVCPSWTHARYIHDTTGIAREKLTMIYLSTNAEWFCEQVERIPTQAIYCSSPDRGLHHVLDLWPDVRAQVPTATLKVYYLLQPWLNFMLARPPSEDEVWKRAALITKQLQILGRNGEQGVEVVGPVSPKKMAKALLASSVLVYPCDPVRFTEGFSVSIMDACMAGCVPLTTPVDALPEVYGGVTHMIGGSPASKKKEWVDAIVGVMQGKILTGIGTSARAYAATHTRQKMAQKWENLIEERRKK